MSEEELLLKLGQIARESELEDAESEEQLLALTRGELSETEFLESFQGDNQIDPATAAEVFAPFDNKFEDRALSNIQSAFKEDCTSSNTSENIPGEVVNLARHQKLSLVKIASPIIGLAAVALLVFALLPRQPIPEYSLVVIGGEKAQRGDPSDERASSLTLSEGAGLELILKPAHATEADIGARIFLVRKGEVVSVDALIEEDRQGAFKITAIVGEQIKVKSGTWKLLIAVGPPADLPEKSSIRLENIDEDVKVFHRMLEISSE